MSRPAGSSAGVESGREMFIYILCSCLIYLHSRYIGGEEEINVSYLKEKRERKVIKENNSHDES